MNTLRIVLTTFISALFMQACTSSGDWDDLPDPIAKFVAHYFPEEGVSQYGENDGRYYVRLHDSASLSFDSSYAWISINGEGSTLPQVLLFDQLPPGLYEAIQEDSDLAHVYAVSRNSSTYNVTLTDSYLSYDIATKEVTVQYPSSTEP